LLRDYRRTTLTNTAVVTWNNLRRRERQRLIDVGGVPGSGNLNGTAWLDAKFTRYPTRRAAAAGLDGGLYLNGALVQSVLTDVNGRLSVQQCAATDGRKPVRAAVSPRRSVDNRQARKADSPLPTGCSGFTNIRCPRQQPQNLNLLMAEWGRLQLV